MSEELVKLNQENRQLRDRIAELETVQGKPIIQLLINDSNSFINTNYGEQIPLEFDISNIGTRKANDINIKIKFPNEVKVLFEDDTVDYGFLSSLKNTRLKMPNATKWSNVGNNIVTIHIQSLLHTKTSTFDSERDKILLIPIEKGKFQASISIICEEFINQENFTLDINII